MNINQLNGFARAVSSTQYGAIRYQQKAGVYLHSQLDGKEEPEAIGQLSCYQQ